jgi:hypothetical protein
MAMLQQLSSCSERHAITGSVFSAVGPRNRIARTHRADKWRVKLLSGALAVLGKTLPSGALAFTGACPTLTDRSFPGQH